MQYFSSMVLRAYLLGSWFDLTDDWLANVSASGEWGHSGIEPLDIMPDVGEMRFVLKNTDGKYYPDGGTPLAGWGDGVKVQMIFTFNSQSYTRFTGYVESIDLITGLTTAFDRVQVTALDWIKFTETHPILEAEVLENKRADEGIQIIIDDMPQPPASYELQTGVNTFPVIFDSVGLRTTAYTELSKFVNSEFGTLALLKDQANGEKLKFFNNNSNLSSELKASFEGEYYKAGITYGKNVINRAVVTAYPKRIDIEPQVLYSLDKPMLFTSQTPIKFRAKYTDPTGGAKVNAIGSSMLPPESPGEVDPYLMTLLNFTTSVEDETGRHTWTLGDPFRVIFNDVYVDGYGTPYSNNILGSYLVLGGYPNYNLTTPTSSDFEFGSGAFTIGWYENLINPAQGNTAMARDNTMVPPFLLGYPRNEKEMKVYFSSNGLTWDIGYSRSLGQVNVGRWTYYEVSRDEDGWFYCFADGKLTDKWYSSLAIKSSTGAFTIGNTRVNEWAWMAFDSFFIKKGQCLHKSNFERPLKNIKPTLDGDYLFNDLENETGEDKSQYLIVTPTYGSEAVSYALTKTQYYGNAKHGWITRLQARGRGVYAYNSIENDVTDETSVNAYGYSEVNLDQKYQTNVKFGTQVVANIVAFEKDPRTRLESISFLANKDEASMLNFLERDIHDLIHVKDTARGIDNFFFIQKIRFDVVEYENVNVTWYLKSALEVDIAQAPPVPPTFQGVIGINNISVRTTLDSVGVTQDYFNEVTVTIDNLSTTPTLTDVGIQLTWGLGDVVGPASAVDDNVVTFDGITGKLIQDSGVGIVAVSSAIAASHAAATVADTASINMSITGQQISADAIFGTTSTTIAQGDHTHSGMITDGDKGDITVSASGATWTIDNNTVTLAKMADMATSSLIYRKTAGTGDPEVNTLATLKTDLGLTGTNSGDQTITLSSDVTGSGTGAITTTIANDAVTLAKMANMATSSLIYRKTAGTGDPEVNTLATLKTDLGLTGTNSGDQTSIVGITGTKAQFDTAVTDGNILYVGDVTQYTDEQAQDAIGAMVDTTLVYTDATPLLTRAALTGDVTASAGSNATTIANDAVTYAKMQNVSATDKVLGRATAGAGDVEEITMTPFARTIIDDTDAATVRATIGAGTGSGTVTSVSGTAPIASSGGATPAISINNDGVTNAILNNMAVNTIKGRITAGTGDPEDLTAANVRTIINVADGSTANAKITSATLDTGTDDTGFTTALAISGSHNVPHVVPSTSGNVMTSNGTDWISSAAPNAPTVTIVDAGGDTTTFPLLGTAATGNLAPATDAGLTYNATTNVLSASGGFAGNLTGDVTGNVSGSAGSATNATNATNIGVTDAAGDTTTFPLLAGSATGTQGALTDAGLTYNATTNALTATTFIGALTGTASNVTTNADLTGDITSVGNATSIAAGVVTLADMANMATASLIYRKTAGAGAPEVNSLATLKTDLALTGTNSGDQTITLTGDVTGTGTGSFATTIGANKVTLGMQATLAANSAIANVTAGAATPTAVSMLATATASSIALRDANANLVNNNTLNGFATTATAAGTTTLTVASKKIQEFTGITTQTVVLPVTSTLALGQTFVIVNNSTGVVTVNSSGGNAVQALAANGAVEVICVLTSGTTAASWQANYINGLIVADLTGTAETLGGAAVVGTATTAARSDHKHAITNPAIDTLAAATDNTNLNASTATHGLVVKASSPASGLYNYVGITNGETAYTNKALFDATSPSTQAFADAAVVGTAAVTARRDHKHAMPAAPTALSVGAIPADGWVSDSNTWTFKNRTQAFTNDPAAGTSIVLNMTSTTDFVVGSDITVTSSAGSENTHITAVVANTSITCNQLLLNHTTTSRLVTLLDSFTINADVTTNIRKGTFLKWTQTTVKYGTVYSATYSGGTTTIVMIHNSDYALTNAAMSSTYWSSSLAYPASWPIWFNYDPAPLGWSVLPSTNISYKFMTFGQIMNIFLQQPTGADATTSNATTMTFSSPCLIVTASGVVNFQAMDNGAFKTGASRTRLGVLGTGNKIITCYSDMDTGAWTAANTKKISCVVPFVDF